MSLHAQATSAPRSRPRLLERLLRRPSRIDGDGEAPDASVNEATASGGARDRVAAMIAAHDAGLQPGAPRRPRGNPAFSEALFIELMRAHQYRRAFEQLSTDCQRSWGSADAFVTAQSGSAMSRLRGVQVRGVRYLERWTDPDRGATYSDVAELRVEYGIGEGAAARMLPRTVHLVADCGHWRSLCYPA
jgi:hypothetical protein